MRIDEVIKPFTGKQVRAKDELTGDWVDPPPPEYLVVYTNERGDEVAVSTHADYAEAELRSKKERLLGKRDARVVEI